MDANVRLLLVVKCDAYGHGLVPVSKIAERTEVDYLGVSSFQEAKKLRSAGIKLPILLMGPCLLEEVKELIELGIEVGISNMKFVHRLDKESRSLKKTATVHINVNTGMGRSGLSPEESIPFIRNLQAHTELRLQGIFSHLSSAHLTSKEDRNFTLTQISIFTELLKELKSKSLLPPLRHIAASDGLVRYGTCTAGYPYNMVRIGELIYGANTVLNQAGGKGLEPVKSITTKVIDIFKLPAGQSVSYGRTYRTTAPIRIALLPIGYAHGLDKRLSNTGALFIKGKKVPIVGEICMNQALVDVTEVSHIKVGDEVEVIGDHIAISDFANWTGASECEILTGLSNMGKRVYVNY